MNFKLLLLTSIFLLNTENCYSCRFCCGGGDDDQHTRSSPRKAKETDRLLTEGQPAILRMTDGDNDLGVNGEQGGAKAVPPQPRKEDKEKVVVVRKAQEDADRTRREEEAAARQREEELRAQLERERKEKDRLAVILDQQRAETEKQRQAAEHLRKEKELVEDERKRLLDQKGDPVEHHNDMQIDVYRPLLHGGFEYKLPQCALGPDEENRVTLAPNFGFSWLYNNLAEACRRGTPLASELQATCVKGQFRESWTEVYDAFENTKRDILKKAADNQENQIIAQRYINFVLSVLEKTQAVHEDGKHELVLKQNEVPVKIQRSPKNNSTRLLIMVNKDAGFFFKFE